MRCLLCIAHVYTIGRFRTSTPTVTSNGLQAAPNNGALALALPNGLSALSVAKWSSPGNSHWAIMAGRLG